MPFDVIVIGAGFAGLAAALDLTRQGLRVQILEARDRVGGRVFTRRDPALNYPIELGAEFVHGLAPEIWLPAQENKLKMTEMEGDLWCSLNGKLQPCNFFGKADKILSAMDDKEPDESFLQFLERRFPGEDHADAKQWATGYVSGFNAADPSIISVHWLVHSRDAEEQIEGDRAFRIAGGYEQLLNVYCAALGFETCNGPETEPRGSVDARSQGMGSISSAQVNGPELHLKTIVQEICWAAGTVRIAAKNSQGNVTFEAPRALITLPLGVLQSSGSVRFHPDLPQEKLAALGHLAMGKVVRVTLCFRERFWKDRPAQGKSLSEMSFLFSHDPQFPTWWTQMPRHLPIITGWAPARSAERLAGMTQGRIVDKALDSLSSLLGVEKSWMQSQLNAAYFHDWDADPFSCGAYSYVKAGGEGCQAILGAPVADTLYFAGEHTDSTGHNGTVHGAIASGRRAAKDITSAKQ